jgi:hypothetical protein
MFTFTVGLLVVAVIAFCVWLLYGARYEKQTCYVPTGEIKFVVAGETCTKVLPNLNGTGYHYDYKTRTIVEGESKILSRPFNILGVYLVSLLYPLKELHVWHFEWDKLSKGNSSENETGFVIVPKSEYVNSLYFLSSYPIVVEEVDLKGNLKINIVVNVTFRVVNPLLPVFVYKGKWLTHMSATIKGAVADFARGKTYDEFRALDKEGEGSSFSSDIEKINKSTNGVAGVIETFGVAVHKVDFVSFDLVGASDEEQAAVTAVELARLEADAAVQKARGIETIGQAEANALNARLKVAHSYTGGMEILHREIDAHAVANFKGDVLSLGERMPLAISHKEKNDATQS